jgi:transposase
MLARMGVALEPDIRPISSQMLSELKELSIARQAHIKDRTAAANREKTLTLPLLKRQNAGHRKQIDTQSAALEAEMQSLIARDQQLAKRLNENGWKIPT